MPLWSHITFLVWALDALSFGASAFLLLRARRRGEYVWGGYLTGLLALDIALIFVSHILAEPGTVPIASPFLAYSLQNLLEFAVPALLVHAFYSEERISLSLRGPWRLAVIATYAASALGFVLPLVTSDSLNLDQKVAWARVASLAAASVTIAILINRTRSGGEQGGKRKFYRWLGPMFGLLVIIHWIDLVRPDPLIGLIQEILPAGLLFIMAYYIQPLTFDILIKEITFYFFVLTVVYTAWWILPMWFEGNQNAYPVLILCVWPIISAAPWFHRKWVRWLDKAVFGRRLTPTEARTAFLIGLEGAVTEGELVRSGERALREIFGAPAGIHLKDVPTQNSVDKQVMMRTEIRLGGDNCGVIEVAPRPRSLQFLGEDVALLESLGQQFAVLLDNIRLREKRLEQERKEKDLQILATRSELKALRAQINPHFLFNSLSAIAGLISKDPSRARETVEQLAEVFRYSLYRSENEWVRLADELEFVGAYLDVERARFGHRLQIEINVDDAARRQMVPAMVLQVLVENAIKHGVSSVRGVGTVSIRGECRGGRLFLEVRDNGSGPAPASGTVSNGSGPGYGLRNVQDRLNLYFKGEGVLRMSREGSMTVVTIEMPSETARDSTETPRR